MISNNYNKGNKAQLILTCYLLFVTIYLLLVLNMRKIPHYSSKKLAKKHQNFAIVYKNLALPLMKFLMKRMGTDQEACEEVFSRTIIAAWRGLHTFEHKSTYFTWICRIALNKIADYYKEQVNYHSKFIVPTLETLANIEDKQLLPEEKLVLDELRECVRECLNLLPEEKRRLLYLRYWRRLSLKEIAKVYCVSERAAEGKLYRARTDFKQIFITKYPHI